MPFRVAVKASILSNKPPLYISGSYRSYAVDKKNSVYVSPPIIDKLIITAPIYPADMMADAITNEETPVQFFHNVLVDVEKHLKSNAYSHPKKTLAGYWCGQKELGVSARLRISVQKFGATKRNIRLEFNPSRFLGAGLDPVADEWAALLLNTIPFAVWLKRARVTALDIAVDLLNAPMHSLLLEAECSKWSYWLSTQHQIQTITTWHKSGSKKLIGFVLYDKRAELLDNGHAARFGELHHVRLERRLHKRQIKLAKLSSLPNPFEGATVKYLAEKTTDADAALFAWAKQYVGIDYAASISHSAQKYKWINELKSSQSAKFWRPEAIWKRWPNALQLSGLQKWITTAMVLDN